MSLPKTAHLTNDDGRSTGRSGRGCLSGRAGLAGALFSQFTLLDLLQLLENSGKSGTLRICLPDGVGQIQFRRGDVVAASFGIERDEEALYRMCRQPEGWFRFDLLPVRKPGRMRRSSRAILLEACRRLDEAQAV